MSRTEFITDDRVSWVSNGVADTDMIGVFLVSHEADRFNTSCLGVLERCVLRLVENSIKDALLGLTLFKFTADRRKTISV